MIFEDESMDFTESLKFLLQPESEIDSHQSSDIGSIVCYSEQMRHIQTSLTSIHLPLLSPRIISRFEGIITEVKVGNNLL